MFNKQADNTIKTIYLWIEGLHHVIEELFTNIISSNTWTTPSSHWISFFKNFERSKSVPRKIIVEFCLIKALSVISTIFLGLCSLILPCFVRSMECNSVYAYTLFILLFLISQGNSGRSLLGRMVCELLSWIMKFLKKEFQWEFCWTYMIIKDVHYDEYVKTDLINVSAIRRMMVALSCIGFPV